MNDLERTPTRDIPWLGGAILIGLGLVFSLQNVTGLYFGNWWALFIAIPGVFALATAWRFYQHDGYPSHRALAAATGGLAPLIVAAVFLFDLDWGRVWPLFLIAAGLGLLAGRSKPQERA